MCPYSAKADANNSVFSSLSHRCQERVDGETRVLDESPNTKAEAGSPEERESTEEEGGGTSTKRCPSAKNNRETQAGLVNFCTQQYRYVPPYTACSATDPLECSKYCSMEMEKSWQLCFLMALVKSSILLLLIVRYTVPSVLELAALVMSFLIQSVSYHSGNQAVVSFSPYSGVLAYLVFEVSTWRYY